MSFLPGRLTTMSLFFILSLGSIPHATASYLSSGARPIPTITEAHLLPRATESFTAVSECHKHSTAVYCMYGATELQVVVPATITGELPPTYTDCHSHGSDSYCVGPDGNDVQVLSLPSSSSESGDSSGSETNSDSQDESAGLNCHFHAGVEHCVGEGQGEGSASPVSCLRRDREYNVPLRIGLLFVILVTSFIGVVAPIFLKPVLSSKFEIVFIILKQFGTGVIIATAFVHLFTHAQLMFTNECIGTIEYEAVTAAIVMAGLFLSFVVETASHRIAQKFRDRSRYNDDIVGVAVLEAGIIFHSLLIGLTLVVAGDSFFITLFIVILFHQMFEGIALGTRIASIGDRAKGAREGAAHVLATAGKDASEQGQEATAADGNADSVDEGKNWKSLSLTKKLIMASAFAVITPIGMAIGIGVLNQFNGNDPQTLIALGTLDALSAGILVWVGVVEMWAADWMFDGELAHAGPVVTALAGLGLIAGMVLMSFLGKWA
ncbi:Zip-domain-containing protein [Durotheca rogersii]|uniref:Zip-domain-containing protein n=1 Tax=Durotheca rogersii TaxID=419775 RepID=UPI0022207367|nr:Zip-domain-containing protein [Durotheca rogersii]KAI5863995.1 Zip-domain-containing protein [Durotheca rogersii]